MSDGGGGRKGYYCTGTLCKHLRVRQHATQLFMESWNPLLWNPGIIKLGFHNHPPDRWQFESEILELNPHIMLHTLA